MMHRHLMMVISICDLAGGRTQNLLITVVDRSLNCFLESLFVVRRLAIGPRNPLAFAR
jgi:hypothetical protein